MNRVSNIFEVIVNNALLRPKITVVIACYNQENTIRLCIESVLAQELSDDFDIIIVDDCSTDSTVDVILEVLSHSDVPAMLVRSKENQYRRGRWAVATIFTSLAKADYIAFIDGDDAWLSTDKLRCQCQILDEMPQVSVTCCDAVRFHHDNDIHGFSEEVQPLKMLFSLADVLRENKVIHSTAVYRSSTVCNVGEWVGKVPLLDYALSLYALRSHQYCCFQSHLLVGYRHSNSGVYSSLARSRQGRLKANQQLLKTQFSFLSYASLNISAVFMTLLSLLRWIKRTSIVSIGR